MVSSVLGITVTLKRNRLHINEETVTGHLRLDSPYKSIRNHQLSYGGPTVRPLHSLWSGTFLVSGTSVCLTSRLCHGL